MKNSIVITPHVINTLKSLSGDEQLAIANALVQEMVLGEPKKMPLSPIQEMVYSIIKFYVRQDSHRYNQSQQILSI